MNSDELTYGQLEAVRNRVTRRVRYLDKLRQRMVANRFPSTDPLFTATCESLHSLERLVTLLSNLADRKAPTLVLTPPNSQLLRPLPRPRKRSRK